MIIGFSLHTPGIVKLWESPGRAGGLPMGIIFGAILTTNNLII
jgi:hypothetical protein